VILTDNDIEELGRKGVKLVGVNGQPVTPKTEKHIIQMQFDYLKRIADLLSRILSKPDPDFTAIKPADVIVHPPDVHVQSPEVHVPPPIIPPYPKPIRKWKFELKKDYRGDTTDIIATALE
jgi:hypothetical protein